MNREGRTRFIEQLAELRSRAGLSLADVGRAAHVARGYVHHIEHGRRWPTQRVAKALDTALGADGALLAVWEAANRAGRPDRADIAVAVSASQQPEAVALMSAADESACLLAWAEASNIGDLTLSRCTAKSGGLRAATSRYPRCHCSPGRGSSVTRRSRWIRATQHTIAFWEHHFLDAEDGLRYATTGSAEAFLASAQALDLAKAGQVDNARAALARSRDATESVEQACDELVGPFTCSVDRAGGFWSDVYLALGQPADALTEADRAVAAFERAPTGQRNPGSERMARIQQVRAHLTLGQFDGAAEALTPVLDTAAEHRVRPLLQRLAEVRTQAMTCEQPDEPALRALREAITDFRRQPAIAELAN